MPGTASCTIASPHVLASLVRSSAKRLPFVGRDRMGVFGICAGGGHALSVAQTERRFKAVATVSAAPMGESSRAFMRHVVRGREHRGDGDGCQAAHRGGKRSCGRDTPTTDSPWARTPIRRAGSCSPAWTGCVPEYVDQAIMQLMMHFVVLQRRRSASPGRLGAALACARAVLAEHLIGLSGSSFASRRHQAEQVASVWHHGDVPVRRRDPTGLAPWDHEHGDVEPGRVGVLTHCPGCTGWCPRAPRLRADSSR